MTIDHFSVAFLIALGIYEIVDLIVDVIQWRRKQKQMASEMLLRMAIDSWVRCPDEACGDCGQETYGEDHACTYLTTVDVAGIRRTSEGQKS